MGSTGVKRKLRALGAALAVACAAAALLAPGASARPGTLDRGFGGNGRLVLEPRLGSDPQGTVRTSLAALPGGGTILLGAGQLRAFHADGSRDRDFGGGAVAVAPPPGYRLELSDVAVDSSGRVLVAGTAFAEGAGGGNGTVELAFLARYGADGELDPGFGEDGSVTTALGLPPQKIPDSLKGPPYATPEITRIRLKRIELDKGGNIVLTGSRVKEIAVCRFSFESVTEGFVARLGSDGSPDPSFGNDGVVPLEDLWLDSAIPSPNGTIYFSAIRGSGEPCSGGSANGATAPLLGHLTSGGSLDPHFGDGGWISLSAGAVGVLSPPGLAIDKGHRLLLFGDDQVRRFLLDGRADRSFGSRGVVTLQGAREGNLYPADAGVEAGGGTLIARTFKPKPIPHAPPEAFYLSRLTPAGRIDRGFGQGGTVRARFGRGSTADASSLLVGHGKVTIAGTARGPQLGTKLALARYLLMR